MNQNLPGDSAYHQTATGKEAKRRREQMQRLQSAQMYLAQTRGKTKPQEDKPQFSFCERCGV